MSYVNELLQIYDRNQDKIGVIEYRGDTPYTLLPPFHTTVTAQITVTIDQNGTFMRAERVEANDKMTIIPVSEKSGSRTAGKEPHPLCDNLRYLAGDYPEYYKDDGSCFSLYIEQLQKWEQSEFCHEKVKAIYQYLKKKTLLHDLVCADIIRLDEKNQIDEKEKIQTIPQPKAFVRFIIRSAMIQPDDNCPDECWKDRTLQESYIAYTREQQKEKGLCYLTGNRETISYLHPKKIRNEGDGAKLISANDSQNFTYRGRFSNKEEAFAVGSETSQKMHNTLKWLIRKQGTFFHTLTLVTWESESLRMPAWEKDTDTIGEEYESSLSSWDDEEEIDVREHFMLLEKIADTELFEQDESKQHHAPEDKIPARPVPEAGEKPHDREREHRATGVQEAEEARSHRPHWVGQGRLLARERVGALARKHIRAWYTTASGCPRLLRRATPFSELPASAPTGAGGHPFSERRSESWTRI